MGHVQVVSYLSCETISLRLKGSENCEITRYHIEGHNYRTGHHAHGLPGNLSEITVHSRRALVPVFAPVALSLLSSTPSLSVG